MNICIIGTGYVGLVTASVIANNGHNVVCVDTDKNKIENLKKGIVPFFEEGLEDLINKNISYLSFTNDIDYAVKNSDICFIAVGTPQKEDGSADLKYVISASEQIAKSVNSDKIIVLKSTAPVGVFNLISEIIKRNTNYNFDIVSNPEFLRQGSAVKDLLDPYRIIVGANSNQDKILSIMQKIYSHCPGKIVMMDVNSAQMVKYASNSFLALKISFINEISNICEKVGANIDEVVIGIGSDPRIGNLFLKPGIGYGGSCFPKDVKALIKTAQDNNYNPEILISADNTNKRQRDRFINKVLNYYSNNLNNKTFAIWGLSFKPNTDDMREAPSITVINALLDKGANIKLYDPKAINNAKLYFGDKVIYCDSKFDTLNNAAALLLLTEWEEFLNIDSKRLNIPVIFDARNITKNWLSKNCINIIR